MRRASVVGPDAWVQKRGGAHTFIIAALPTHRDHDLDGQARREGMREMVERTRRETPKGLSLLRPGAVNDRVPHKPNGSIHSRDCQPKDLH